MLGARLALLESVVMCFSLPRVASCADSKQQAQEPTLC